MLRDMSFFTILTRKTPQCHEIQQILWKRRRQDFQKIDDGAILFPAHPSCEHTFHCWENITRPRTLHWRVWRLLQRRVWQNLLFPIPPGCPAELFPSCDRFLLALHLQLALGATGKTGMATAQLNFAQQAQAFGAGAKWDHRTPAGFESTGWCCLDL